MDLVLWNCVAKVLQCRLSGVGLRVCLFKECLRGNCTPSQNLTGIVSYIQIINTVLKYNISILKWLAWETQDWHWNLTRTSGSWYIDQNVQKLLHYKVISGLILKFMSPSSSVHDFLPKIGESSSPFGGIVSDITCWNTTRAKRLVIDRVSFSPQSEGR